MFTNKQRDDGWMENLPIVKRKASSITYVHEIRMYCHLVVEITSEFEAPCSPFFRS